MAIITTNKPSKERVQDRLVKPEIEDEQHDQENGGNATEGKLQFVGDRLYFSYS